MLSIRDLPSSERPRERLVQYGAESLSTVELLAIILGSGSRRNDVIHLSSSILSRFDIGKLPGVSVTELTEFDGISTAKACSIAAGIELGKRALMQRYTNQKKIRGAEDVVNLLKPLIGLKEKENFVVLMLDSRNNLIRQETVAVGSINASLIHPREIFRQAIIENAAAVVIAHNHPSGDPEPSLDDIRVTKQLVRAGHLLGIELLDHVIVSRNGFYSFMDERKKL